MSDPFDLNSLRLDPGIRLDTGVVSRRAQKRKSQFVKVPMEWMHRRGQAKSVATFKVALHLLDRHFRDRGRPCRLANLALAPAGVQRKQKYRALSELERLGLVRVERRRRKSPIVTVIVDPQSGEQL